MIIDDVHRGITKNKKRKRIGRGVGSGFGKTAGRGHKGAGSRNGHSARTGFAGGQMPLFRVVAKRGFNNKAFATRVLEINIATLEANFESGDLVNVDTLTEKGLAKGKYDVIKILAKGELTKSLNVSVHRFSESAAQLIEASGGSVERV